MDAQAKTINLLLYHGSLHGVISLEDSRWNSGEMYSAPRESTEDLLATGACNKFGVYLLISHNRIYVGQSSDLAKRLTQHIIGKDWWESVVILTTKDDSLNHADIDYIESVLIKKAASIEGLNCENKTKGNPAKVDRFRKVFLGQYLDEALFLMDLIGITVFSTQNGKRGTEDSPAVPVINTMDIKTRLSLGRRAKSEAISFLKERGIIIGKRVSYSSLQGNGADFWINPQTKMIQDDWQIILNDSSSNELIVLTIPANSLTLDKEGLNGLAVRSDKPELIDLLININTLVDKRSGTDFAPFVQCRIPY